MDNVLRLPRKENQVAAAKAVQARAKVYNAPSVDGWYL